MSTNRPFFANFLAAFRAQSATYKAAKPPSPGPTTTALSSPHVGAAGPVSPSSAARGITTKSISSSSWGNGSNTPSGSQQSSSTSSAQSTAQPSSSFTSLPTHNHSHSQSHPASPLHQPRTTQPLGQSGGNSNSQSPAPVAGSSPVPVPSAGSHARQRRGSDSSSGSGGFRDALGSDRWYVGGQTANGEERFYPLGMVKKRGGRLSPGGRVGSIDQLSL